MPTYTSDKVKVVAEEKLKEIIAENERLKAENERLKPERLEIFGRVMPRFTDNGTYMDQLIILPYETDENGKLLEQPDSTEKHRKYIFSKTMQPLIIETPWLHDVLEGRARSALVHISKKGE